MKTFKKFPVAVAITAAVVALCIAFSVLSAPAPMPKVTPGDWVCDNAGVLSENTVTQIRGRNAQFDASYEAYVAVLTVKNERNWDDLEFAQQVYENWELGSGDFLLILDIGDKMDYLYYGDKYTDFDYGSVMASYVDPYFFEGDYDQAVVSLLEGMDEYLSVLNAGSAGSNAPVEFTPGASSGLLLKAVLLLAVVIILVILILSAMDRSRYNSWERASRRNPQSNKRFVPLLFWHSPGSSWYRRRRASRAPRRRSPPRDPGSYGRPGPGPRPGGARHSSPPPRPRAGGSRPGSGPRPGGVSRPRPSSGSRPSSVSRPRPSAPRSGGSRSGGFGGGGRGGHGGGFGGGGRSSGHR